MEKNSTSEKSVTGAYEAPAITPLGSLYELTQTFCISCAVG